MFKHLRQQLELSWLPQLPESTKNLRQLSREPTLNSAVALARHNLDFTQTRNLDQIVCDAKLFQVTEPSIRVAVLGSATMAYLAPGIRVAGLRRQISVEIWQGEPGQYWQELFEPGSPLMNWRPDTVVLSFDPWHMTAGLQPVASKEERDRVLNDMLKSISQCWRELRNRFACQIIHQMPLPVFPSELGQNDHRFPGSRAELLRLLCHRIRKVADAEGVDLLSLDLRAAYDGLALWHNRPLWLRARQEVAARASPTYGELVARLLAARQDWSAKCLVLDLDNTIWGGEVGECGVDGIVIGQGSATGEAFLDVQRYALSLNARGVILAVCSKNELAVARAPFEDHPDMILRLRHIAAFQASWDAKPQMLRAISEELNIGLDSMVFLDDSPFERGLVRRDLINVMVPEVPEDPALVPSMLAEAGYFEALAITEDDQLRTAAYTANRSRQELRSGYTDLTDYLCDLDMQLNWSAFQKVDIKRLSQLSGRTNQFMLTAKRYSEEAIHNVMQSENCLTFQFRLRDRFGENGLIALAVASKSDKELEIQTIQMSCRVLGRRIEEGILEVIASAARDSGLNKLTGRFESLPRNNMVRDLYPRLGFDRVSGGDTGSLQFELMLEDKDLPELPMTIKRENE